MTKRKHQTPEKKLTLPGKKAAAWENKGEAPNPKTQVAKGTRASFYTRVLDEAQAMDFETAAGADGLDDEITLLRVKIKELIEKEPENVQLLMAATNILAKLVKTRYSMNKKQEKNLGQAIKNIIKDIGVPLGVTVLGKKL